MKFVDDDDDDDEGDCIWRGSLVVNVPSVCQHITCGTDRPYLVVGWKYAVSSSVSTEQCEDCCTVMVPRQRRSSGGTSSRPIESDLRCWQPEADATGTQSSERLQGAVPLRHLHTNTSNCRSDGALVMCHRLSGIPTCRLKAYEVELSVLPRLSLQHLIWSVLDWLNKTQE